MFPTENPFDGISHCLDLTRIRCEDIGDRISVPCARVDLAFSPPRPVLASKTSATNVCHASDSTYPDDFAEIDLGF
jgi:hypothetical protein